MSTGMKASELIAALQKIMDERGDLPVYSHCDYEYVHEVEFFEDGAMGTGEIPVILLT